jgi:hypothetical protein
VEIPTLNAVVALTVLIVPLFAAARCEGLRQEVLGRSNNVPREEKIDPKILLQMQNIKPSSR